jgi:hypothetical protein
VILKRIIFFALVFAGLLWALVYFRNTIACSVLSQTLTGILGAETRVESVNIGINEPTIEIKGLEVYNPSGFVNEPFLAMPVISCKYDFDRLLKGKIYIENMTIAMRELVVAINDKGELNVNRLKVMEKPKDNKPVAMPKFMVHGLKLQLGRVVTKNYAAGDNQVVAQVDFKMKERSYYDISSFAELVESVLVDTMKVAGVKGVQAYGEHLLTDLGKNLIKQLDAKGR